MKIIGHQFNLFQLKQYLKQIFFTQIKFAYLGAARLYM